MGKKQAFAFLEELQQRGIQLGLERIERFLGVIGNPERRFKSVHVAGTNGKGSTAAMIESILLAAGRKTGLYTSPHLVRFSERIRVGGKEIGEKELVGLIAELKEKMRESGIGLTYFEFVTALAFRHFAERGVEIAVVEVGMGGRLDATNVVMPVLSIITNVEREHEEHLGRTVEKIAVEKAGIIKEGIPVVTAEWKEKVLGVFREKCREKNAELLVVEKPFEGKLGMLGGFQKWNAALAAAAAERIGVGKGEIEKGLAAAKWPGRFEVARERPTVVLDCAHNPGCCRVLVNAFEAQFPGKKALLVVGVSSDKSIERMAEKLSPIVKKVFATGASYRAMEIERVAAAFREQGKEVVEVRGVANAVKKAISSAKEGDVVLVTGSCFVVGEAMRRFSW